MNSTNKVELLAPAGNLEKMKIALNYGADAVYGGTSTFSLRIRSGKVIGSDQRVYTYTALQAMTTGPAWQVFEENRKGMIKEGMLADFVVIKNNPLKQKVEDLKDNEVLVTVKEGKVIFEKSAI